MCVRDQEEVVFFRINLIRQHFSEPPEGAMWTIVMLSIVTHNQSGVLTVTFSYLYVVFSVRINTAMNNTQPTCLCSEFIELER